jgi:hypothetical protein
MSRSNAHRDRIVDKMSCWRSEISASATIKRLQSAIVAINVLRVDTRGIPCHYWPELAIPSAGWAR